MAKPENLGDKNRKKTYSTKCCTISLLGTLLSASLFTVTQMTIHMITAKGQLILDASLEWSQNLLVSLL